jgi:hypothetical protein
MQTQPLFILPCVLSLASCVIDHHTAALQYDSKTVEAEGAERVHVAFKMGAGDLRVTDGAQQLARADFSFNVPSWKPEVTYSKIGDRGTLTIRQPGEAHSTTFGNNRYRWDVQLSNKIPMDLEVHFGAGQARLDVGSLDLRGVEAHAGVGQVDLDLRGKPKHGYDVNINGGIGEATVRVPVDAGVYAEAHGGIGSIEVRGLRKMDGHWESESYTKSDNKIRIEAHGGIGSIKIVAD